MFEMVVTAQGGEADARRALELMAAGGIALHQARINGRPVEQLPEAAPVPAANVPAAAKKSAKK